MASPELEILIQQLRSQVVGAQTVEEMRAEFEKVGQSFEIPSDVTCEPVDAGGVRAEWIEAPGADPGRVVVYFHAGGYTIGSINTHRHFVQRISRAAQARCLALDYRLAPEHRFPAAIEDATAAFRWLVKRGVSAKRIVFAGDSCGGAMTVSTMVNLRDQGDPLPAAGICFSPFVDLECSGESMKTRAHLDPLVKRETLLWLAAHYLGDADPRSPLASPIHADLRGLSPLYILVGGREIEFDESTRLAEHAKKAGVEVILEIWEEMIHAFPFFASVLPEGRQAIEKVGQFIRSRT